MAASQRFWNPGLDNAGRSLGSIYRSMPGDLSSTVPWYVRLLENPDSPVALAGAVDLRGHDGIQAHQAWQSDPRRHRANADPVPGPVLG